MNKCENCNIKMTHKYASGRFCNLKCARAFSTKNKRKEINAKVSKKLLGRSTSDETRLKLKEAWSRGCYDDAKNRLFNKISNDDMFVENSLIANYDIKKRLYSENIKSYKCERCNISEYNGEHITLQLHHINGINNDNRLDNLQILCPNCHSQTANYAGKRRV